MLDQETKEKKHCVHISLSPWRLAYRLYQRELAVRGGRADYLWGFACAFLAAPPAVGGRGQSRSQTAAVGSVGTGACHCGGSGGLWCIGNAVLTVPQDDRHLSAVVNELQPGAAEGNYRPAYERNTGYWAERDTFDFLTWIRSLNSATWRARTPMSCITL